MGEGASTDETQSGDLPGLVVHHSHEGLGRGDGRKNTWFERFGLARIKTVVLECRTLFLDGNRVFL